MQFPSIQTEPEPPAVKQTIKTALLKLGSFLYHSDLDSLFVSPFKWDKVYDDALLSTVVKRFTCVGRTSAESGAVCGCLARAFYSFGIISYFVRVVGDSDRGFEHENAEAGSPERIELLLGMQQEPVQAGTKLARMHQLDCLPSFNVVLMSLTK